MKRSASLLLLELLIMLLVFAVSAALCLNIFFKADTKSRESIISDNALLQAQNVAESIKASDGDFKIAANSYGGTFDGDWTVFYNKDWEIVETKNVYRLVVTYEDTDIPLLGQAKITVSDRDDNILSLLTVSWQEAAR